MASSADFPVSMQALKSAKHLVAVVAAVTGSTNLVTSLLPLRWDFLQLCVDARLLLSGLFAALGATWFSVVHISTPS